MRKLLRYAGQGYEITVPIDCRPGQVAEIDKFRNIIITTSDIDDEQ